jgi:hypothetical protein
MNNLKEHTSSSVNPGYGKAAGRGVQFPEISGVFTNTTVPTHMPDLIFIFSASVTKSHQISFYLIQMCFV